MTTSPSLRTLAAVLLVTLVLLTVWSVYNLYSADRSAASPTPHTVASFSGLGQSDFVAALLPNVLCNCTQVTGGNTTLFASITQWVNVSIESSVSLSIPGTISLADHFAVVLSTPVWSKPLYSALNESGAIAGTSATVQDHFSINVSMLENLTKQIDEQLAYTSAEATLTVSQVVEGTVSVDGLSGFVTVAPVANFTFTSATLTSGILQPASSGVLQSTAGTDGPIPWSAYAFLIGAAAALLAVVGWYVSLAPRPGTEEEPLPDLEELIAPYDEVIAETRIAPDTPMVVPIERWKDLVKISDTLGKPILRPRAQPPATTRASFYVIDGEVGYVYRYRSRDPTPVQARPVEGLPMEPSDLVQRARALGVRTEALTAADPRYREAVIRFRRLRSLLQARRWPEAQTALEKFEEFLGPP